MPSLDSTVAICMYTYEGVATFDACALHFPAAALSANKIEKKSRGMETRAWHLKKRQGYRLYPGRPIGVDTASFRDLL